MNRKPLWHSSYGSIGHLPDSRLGPGDHCVPDGQAAICTFKCRQGDRVYVEEKLDGSCCAVANIDGEIVALTRKGYLASTSPYEQHWLFGAWVSENRWIFKDLPLKWRIVGEWIAQACGTIYDDVECPFWPFDIFNDRNRRLIRDDFWNMASRMALINPPLLVSPRPIPTHHAMSILSSDHGRDPYTKEPEGLVYRVERDNRVDFLAKWVRPDKVDGCYLPEVSGCPAVWNWGPKKERT